MGRAQRTTRRTSSSCVSAKIYLAALSVFKCFIAVLGRRIQIKLNENREIYRVIETVAAKRTRRRLVVRVVVAFQRAEHVFGKVRWRLRLTNGQRIIGHAVVNVNYVIDRRQGSGS